MLPDGCAPAVARRVDVTPRHRRADGRPPGREENERRLRATPTRWASGRDVSSLGPVPLDRLLPLYRDYDLFVLPTLPGEGIPRVLLEAMTAGVPIVTTRVAGIPSLVTHEVNGWLVEKPTADAVAERRRAPRSRMRRCAGG